MKMENDSIVLYFWLPGPCQGSWEKHHNFFCLASRPLPRLMANEKEGMHIFFSFGFKALPRLMANEK